MNILQSEIFNTPLFDGIAKVDIEKMLGCLSAREKHFLRGETIYECGAVDLKVAIVLSGEVYAVRSDINGGRAILMRSGANELFGETSAARRLYPSPVSFEAAQDCHVLLLDYRRMMSRCERCCECHTAMVENLIGLLAEHSLRLTRKLEHLAKRSTREKLLSYLYEQSGIAGSSEFVIPFDRVQLADYLCVDRSGLCVQLARLQREGVLTYEHNRFKLLSTPE